MRDLPNLAADVTPTTDDIAALWRDGHVTIRSVCSRDEVAVFGPLLRAAASAVPALEPTDAEGEVYARAFRQHTNLWRTDAAAARFSLAPRLGRLAAALLRTPAVRIYHDQALFKRGGDGPTPWHQDKHYWPIDGELLTLWMPLVEVDAAMGTMRFARGTHRRGPLSDQPISAAAEAALGALVVREGFEVVSTGPMRAGDASFHLAWTLHGADANRTTNDRDVMTVIFVPDGARVTVPVNDGQRVDLATWMPGLGPGDLVASPLNPICWPT